jgi:putative transposase
MEEIKRHKIKKSILDTKTRRSQMTCKVVELKIDRSSLSCETIKAFDRLFLETKWIYNAILASDDMPNFDTKVDEVQVKVLDAFETRTLDQISAQMKQGVKTRIFNALSTLKALKANGHRIGRLKFKSQIDSIPLKQHLHTFTILKNSRRIKIQGVKQAMKIYGLEQLPSNCEIANANLVRVGEDFYLKVTIYVPKEVLNPPNQSVGIDFGCTTQLTLSNGEKIAFQVPVSQRIKRLDRELARKVKGSKNRQKCLNKRQKAYQETSNQRKEVCNQMVSKLTKKYRVICFQDESISAWKSGGHGKKIQFSAIGGIISALQRKAVTPVVVNKFYPSTQLCSKCGHRQKIGLEIRDYACPSCKSGIDRDVNAARNIEIEGLKQLKILAERKEFTPVETLTPSPKPTMVLTKAGSMNQETKPLLVG